MSYIFDEEDGKQISIKHTSDKNGLKDIIITFKDGSSQIMPWSMWRTTAFVIVGLTDAALDDAKEG